MVNLQESGLRRSPQIATMKALTSIMAVFFTPVTAIPASFDLASSGICHLNRSANLVEKNFDDTLNYIAHHAFAVGKENNKTSTFRKMLKQDDQDNFIDAMQAKVDAHPTREHWEIIPLSQMPKEMKTIMAIWSFKHKHLPNEILNKQKARLCAHCGMQQWGINYWETYAPVKLSDGNFVLRQPFLIQCILEALGIEPSMTNKHSVPVIGPLLSRDTNGPAQKGSWSYRSNVGMLGYLQGSTRPEISMAVHQCARFNAYPMLCYEKAVKWIVRYLLGSIYKTDSTHGLKVFVDADFAGGWSSGNVHNPEVVLSRTGYVIMYAGCPITWSSKLQTQIALSTTKAEYITLSQA
ncbi:hypothetical protein ACHAWX_001485, partial [Stephanocyclus meneghinianus]